jgi:predicted dehydrogenase
MSDSKSSTMTRRDFAKTTAAAAGFAILASGSGVSAATRKAKTLNVGLIGAGGRGTGAAMQMLQGNENVRLIAVADIFEDKVEAAKKTFDPKNPRLEGKVDLKDKNCFAGIDAYKELLKTDVDVVVQGTLPYCRPEQVAAAIDAGKHVFTEKPAGVDPAGIRVFLAAAEKAREKNLCIAAGTQRRHQKEYVETIQKIHDGAIGDIVAMRAYWCGTLPFVHARKPEWKTDLEYRIRNWYGFCWVAGDSIVEQHVHNLDVINWVKGTHPVSVFASGGRTWKPNEERFGDIYDHFDCDYEYPDGSHMTSLCRHWEGDGGVFEEVVGTKGRSNCTDMGEHGMDPYVQEHIDLVQAIRGEAPYLNEGVEVAHSTLTAIMGRMSAYTGKKVTWDEALNAELNIVPALDFSKPYPCGPVPKPGAHKV